jgi:hypothetical protein
MRSSLSPDYDRFFNDLVAQAIRLNFDPRFKPCGRNYVHFHTSRSSFRSGFFYSVSFSRDGFRVELALEANSHDGNRQMFDSLKQDQADIEEKLGRLTWDRGDRDPPKAPRKACRIYVRRDGSIRASPAMLSELKSWALRMLPLFREVFDSRLGELDS